MTEKDKEINLKDPKYDFLPTYNGKIDSLKGNEDLRGSDLVTRVGKKKYKD